MKSRVKFILLGFVVIAIGLLSLVSVDAMNKKKIIYVWDPLCGWCYGFEPQMEKVQAEFGDEYEFEVIVGGMVLPPNGYNMAQMRQFLTGAIPQLEKTTGIKIGQPYYDNILSQDSLKLYSVKPALVYNYLKPKYVGREVILANTIQKMLYEQGQNTNEIETYKALIESNGISFSEAKVNIDSKENVGATYQMFQRSRALGVTGYPAVLIETEKGVKTVSSGFTTYEKLRKQLD